MQSDQFHRCWLSYEKFLDFYFGKCSKFLNTFFTFCSQKDVGYNYQVWNSQKIYRNPNQIAACAVIQKIPPGKGGGGGGGKDLDVCFFGHQHILQRAVRISLEKP